jgi:hypothetical protein
MKAMRLGLAVVVMLTAAMEPSFAQGTSSAAPIPQPAPPPEPAPPAASAADLAKKLANPISDLVSIPFQFNWDQGVGPTDGLRFMMYMQPVVPMSLTDKWNVVGRFILPLVFSQPPLVEGGDPQSGTGDIIFSAFLSPKQSKLIWGVGPVFGLPTTTNPVIGTGKWSLGPTFVVLKQQGPWTVGALANHLWSVGSASNVERQDVNQTYVQPFLAYGLKSGVTFTLSSETSANWEAEDGEQWTVPLILQVSKVTRLGPFPFSMGAAYGYYVEKPDGGPGWKLRMNFSVLLPRAGPKAR